VGQAMQRRASRLFIWSAVGVTLAFSVGSFAQSSFAQSDTAPGTASPKPPEGVAQSEPAASEVARAVQAFYDQTHDVTASFHQTYVNKLYKRTDRSSGRVVFKKPGMMRWDYAQPNGKVMASTGKSFVVYDPGDEGEPGQVIEQTIAQSQLPQALAFLMGTGKLENDFTFRLLDGAAEGFTTGDVLELRPKTPTPHFDRLLFYVERAAAVRGLVRRMLIIDGSGNRNRFDFSKLKFNSNVDLSTFKYTPPPGTRRVQM